MAYTIVTVAMMQFHAGENVDATGNVDANHQFLHDEAAAYLSMLLEYDVEGNWGTLDDPYKDMISEWAARYAAMSLISYNMAGYTSRVEAEDMVNIHVFRMRAIEKILKEIGARKLLGGS